MRKVCLVEVVHEFEDPLAFCKVVYLEQDAVRQNFGYRYRQRPCHAHAAAARHALIGVVILQLPLVQLGSARKCPRSLPCVFLLLKQELELWPPR